MSYYVEFTAKDKSDALIAVDTSHMPDVVRNHIKCALFHVKDGESVYVKVNGHLADGSSSAWSSNTMEVKPITFYVPPPRMVVA